MSILYGRWFGKRDLGFIEGINREMLDRMLQITVVIYKIVPDVTPTNIYGETPSNVSKQFYPGITVTCNINKGEISTDPTDFGPDRKQNVVFQFLESKLKAINLYPQNGDIIEYNDRLHEIDDVAQEQLLGGITEKSLSIICNSHYSRLSKSDLYIRT